MANPSSAKGQRVKTQLITRTHGPTAQSLIDDWGFTPATKQGEIYEVGLERIGHIYNVPGGGEVDIMATLKNERHLAAALQDRDPAAAGVLLDQARFQPFHVISNILSEDEKQVIGSLVALECLAVSPATKIPANDIVKLAVKAKAKEIKRLEGIGLAYVRCNGGTPSAAIPAAPVLSIVAAGGTPFATTDVISVALAKSTTVNNNGDPAPLSTEPLTPIGGIASIPINAAADKVVATFPDPGAASYAVYVGLSPDDLHFYDWAETGDITMDIVRKPTFTNPSPVQADQSGIYAVGNPPDFTFGAVTEAGINYTQAVDLTFLNPLPLAFEGTGAPWVYVLKNGIAQPLSIAQSAPWGFSPSRKTFFLAKGYTLGASENWELILPIAAQVS